MLNALQAMHPGGTSGHESAAESDRIDDVFHANPDPPSPILQPKAMGVNSFFDSKITSLSNHSAVEAEFECRS
jgi:hypothetical protein